MDDFEHDRRPTTKTAPQSATRTAIAAILLANLLGSACAESSEPLAPVAAPPKDASPIVVAPPVDGGGPADAASPPSCTEYCDQMMSNCVSEYPSGTECLKACANFSQGTFGERMQNTLACRQYYAGQPAITAPAQHCPSASMLGGEVCGSRCEAFCQLTFSACGADAPYPSEAECRAACTTMPGYPLVDAAANVKDSLNCRVEQLTLAFSDSTKCAMLGVRSDVCK